MAMRDPCLKTRDEELRAVTGRKLVALELGELEGFEPPQSWILAVLLCSGDSTDEVTDWVRRYNADPKRVWFFPHPKVERNAFRPWEKAGFPMEHVDYVTDWKQLHPYLGMALNDQVYADWRAADDE